MNQAGTVIKASWPTKTCADCHITTHNSLGEHTADGTDELRAEARLPRLQRHELP